MNYVESKKCSCYTEISIGEVMKKIIKKIIQIIPTYSFFPLIFSFTFNMIVYTGSRMIAGEWHHYNIETFLDRRIPFWAPSAIIYLGCYLFWIANYILIARQEKKEVYRFFAADFLSRVICLAFFLLFPTTNIRPELSPVGFWNKCMIIVYSVDAADNLFPSIHCLVSWFCYIGIRGNKDISKWYRGFSCIMALLVCLSTLLTKQHVIVDVAGGILLAEICFYFGKKSVMIDMYEKFQNGVNKIIRLGGHK